MPRNPYPTDHNVFLEAAQEEIKTNARSEIEGTIEDFDSYDVVFVGYPNWNVDMPYILYTYTFFETYDFSGKTIVPLSLIHIFLIVHTHGTESYNDYGVDYYNNEMSFRSDDNNENMIHIGNILTAMLEDAGYGVIHDKTQHDNPDYNNSYSSSRSSIEYYLERCV